MRVMLYLRQSDTDQAGASSLSLDSQEAALRERAAAEGWAVVGAEREPDLRGWQDETERPALSRALDRARAGDYDALLVFDLSRLARSLRIQETIAWDLGRHGVDVVSHTEPWAGATMMRQILGAVAEERTREIAKHVRRAIKERVRRGAAWGIPPFGFARPQPGGPLAPDPDTAHLAVELHEAYAAGASPSAVADILTARGTPTPRGLRVWRPETVIQILDNPVYLGEAVVNGERVPGAHPAIVDPDLKRRVLARRAEKGRRAPRRKAAASWLEGLIRHGHPCNAPLYLMPSRRPGERPFFRCARLAQSRRELLPCPVYPRRVSHRRAEEAVRAALASDLAAALTVREAVAAAEAAERDRDGLAARRRREAASRLARAESRRAKAEELYLSGARDRAWFDVQDATIGGEMAAARADLAACPAAPDTGLLRATARRLTSLAPLILALPDDDLRAVLAELGTAVVGADGIAVAYRPEVAAFLGRR